MNKDRKYEIEHRVRCFKKKYHLPMRYDGTTSFILSSYFVSNQDKDIKDMILKERTLDVDKLTDKIFKQEVMYYSLKKYVYPNDKGISQFEKDVVKIIDDIAQDNFEFYEWKLDELKHDIVTDILKIINGYDLEKFYLKNGNLELMKMIIDKNYYHKMDVPALSDYLDSII